MSKRIYKSRNYFYKTLLILCYVHWGPVRPAVEKDYTHANKKSTKKTSSPQTHPRAIFKNTQYPGLKNTRDQGPKEHPRANIQKHPRPRAQKHPKHPPRPAFPPSRSQLPALSPLLPITPPASSAGLPPPSLCPTCL